MGATLAGALALSAACLGPAGSDLVAEDAWARPVEPTRSPFEVTGAAYLALTNRGSEAVRVVGVGTPVAARAEVHQTFLDQGLVRMRPLDALELGPGETVRMEPGGVHVMLAGLTRDLLPGERFPMTVRTAAGDTVAVTVEVRLP